MAKCIQMPKVDLVLVPPMGVRLCMIYTPYTHMGVMHIVLCICMHVHVHVQNGVGVWAFV